MKNDRKIKHHLSEDLLMRYSNGTLCEAFSLAVATHISKGVLKTLPASGTRIQTARPIAAATPTSAAG